MTDLNSIFSYGTFNREIAVAHGTLVAVLLGHLANRENYHKKRNELIEIENRGGGWFYNTMEDIKEQTGMTRENQDTALKKLINLGYVLTVIKGVPGKKYFQLNEDKIFQFFGLSKNHSRMRDSHNLDCGNHTTRDVGITQTGHIVEELKEEPKKEPPPPGEKNGGGADKNLKDCGQGVFHTSPSGKKVYTSSSDVFSYFLKSQIPTETIIKAIIIANGYHDPISNIFSWIEAVCKRLMNSIESKEKKPKVLEYEKREKIKAKGVTFKDLEKNVR
jgi:hypothetical protein